MESTVTSPAREPSVEATAGETGRTQRPLRLLVIEDDAVDRMALERFLSRSGLPYECTMVETLGEAEELLAVATLGRAEELLWGMVLPGCSWAQMRPTTRSAV